MHFKTLAILVAATLLAMSCATKAEDVPLPGVEINASEPYSISPASSPGELDLFRSSITVSTDPEVVIQEFHVAVMDIDGNDVYAMSSRSPEPEGSGGEVTSVPIPSEIIWNGMSQDGRSFVTDGTYYLTVAVVDNFGQRFETSAFKILVDNRPPSADVGMPYFIFSPDGDGNRDNLTIEQIEISGGKWNASILNQSGEIVRSWEWSETLPKSLEWDGTDSRGETVPDGRYTYLLRGLDEAGNAGEVNLNGIIVDTAIPTLTLSTKQSTFSPNEDGVRDTLAISSRTSNREDIISWRYEVLNGEGTTVEEQSGGMDFPNSFVFSGASESGSYPEGEYRGYVEIRYRNGVVVEALSDLFTIDLDAPSASITVKNARFSPVVENGTFVVEQSVSNGVLWRGRIMPADGDSPILQVSWDSGNVPERFVWNGQTSSGKTAASGKYRYVLKGWDKAGNNVVLESDTIFLDRDGPAIELDIAPIPFSPDGDGNNDVLIIQTKASDSSRIANWKMSITDPNGEIFISSEGEGAPPENIAWEGRGENGDLVESAREYMVSMRLIDETGNESTMETAIPVGILVQRDKDGGLRLRITGIHFAPYEADYIDLEDPELIEENRDILDRVAEILKAYPDRRIRIEGHAAHLFTRPDLMKIEQEETLIPLSLKRAEAIRGALVDRGLAPEGLSVEAKGGSEPIVPPSDATNRWKNRRVEFILLPVAQN